ncbi:MAG: nucleoside triphosphate pyrophosphohydrolase [Candidatus Melainabacteria bacterium HGW-Melainabacteria-1]|nr:MAG: nucleoside triphosphate pyrophosphohydrolase [Candidatus Melainabacteria bacterium HGW-Melainabacteria-1]
MASRIEVVGLGPGPTRYLTLETRDLLLAGQPVYLRTAVHPTVAGIREWGCRYSSFDQLYETAADFDSLYQQIVAQLLAEAKAHGQIVYAVPGNPLVAESTVTRLLAAAPASEVNVTIHTAVSCIDVIFEALGFDPTDGVSFLDGLGLDLSQLHLDQPMLITQVYSQAIAAEVKLLLLERLDPSFAITVIRAAGCEDQRIETMALEELDRIDWIDHLTSVWVPAGPPESRSPLAYLRHVVDQLRDPVSGCPWDLKQTPQSLRKYVLEEAYEVVHALDQGEPDDIREELGDLLFQVYLQSRLAQDQGDFDLDEVAKGIADKLVYRHPHVFAGVAVADAEEVKQNWETLKAQEKAAKAINGSQSSLLADLPLALPGLALADKISRKAAHVGFDWPEVSGVLAKIEEEYQELRAAVAAGSPEEIFHELGDVLFTLVNLARWYRLDPEDAMHKTNQRFVRRFQAMERQLAGRSLGSLEAPEWERLWNLAKQEVG